MVTSEFLVDLLKAGEHRPWTIVEHALPDDAEIVGFMPVSFTPSLVGLIIASESFAEQDYGAKLPELPSPVVRPLDWNAPGMKVN